MTGSKTWMQLAAVAVIAGSVTAMGQNAQAAKIHDKATDFSTLTFLADQNVSAPRDDTNNMFDNNDQMLFSLGLDNDAFTSGSDTDNDGEGGQLTFIIDPTTNQLVSGLVIETTNPGQHLEAARIEIGKNGSWFDVGTMFNDAQGSGSASQNDTNVATLAFSSAGSNTSRYELGIVSGTYNAVRITDLTLASFPSTSSTDGFDIGRFQVTSVPVPATIGLLGISLIGLGAAMRRRNS